MSTPRHLARLVHADQLLDPVRTDEPRTTHRPETSDYVVLAIGLALVVLGALLALVG